MYKIFNNEINRWNVSTIFHNTMTLDLRRCKSRTNKNEFGVKH